MRRFVTRAALTLAAGAATLGVAAGPAAAAPVTAQAQRAAVTWTIVGYYPQAGGGLLTCQSDGAAGALQGYWTWNYTCDSRYLRGYYALVVSR
jgi:hypothetical protein